MIIWWLGNLVLLVVVAPVVVVLLKGVLTAARQIVPIITVAAVATKDLEPIPLLLTTQAYIVKTVETVANYGGSLDVILDDA